jgi:hypothetical protein
MKKKLKVSEVVKSLITFGQALSLHPGENFFFSEIPI